MKEVARLRVFSQQSQVNGQGIRTRLRTFGAPARELEIRRNRGQSRPRQLHYKPQRRVADPTDSLMQEKEVSVKICARVRQRRGGRNGRVHDPMHVMITATLEVWVLSQARPAKLEEEGRYVK